MCTHCQEWIKKKWLGAAKQKNLESPSIPTSVLHEYNNLYVKSARLHVAQPLHCGPPSVAAASAHTVAHLNATLTVTLLSIEDLQMGANAVLPA